LIAVLAHKAFGRVERASMVAHSAIGAKHLVLLDDRAACRVGDAGQDAALCIGQVEIRAVGIGRTEQVTG
jgi:hypothetical protein